MVLHIILADILLIARIFPRPSGARKNTTQLAKYPRVLYVKPSNKIYIIDDCRTLQTPNKILSNYLDSKPMGISAELSECRHKS